MTDVSCHTSVRLDSVVTPPNAFVHQSRPNLSFAMSCVTSSFTVVGAARLGASPALRGKAVRANARVSVARGRGATLRVNAEGTYDRIIDVKAMFPCYQQ